MIGTKLNLQCRRVEGAAVVRNLHVNLDVPGSTSLYTFLREWSHDNPSLFPDLYVRRDLSCGIYYDMKLIYVKNTNTRFVTGGNPYFAPTGFPLSSPALPLPSIDAFMYCRFFLFYRDNRQPALNHHIRSSSFLTKTFAPHLPTPLLLMKPLLKRSKSKTRASLSLHIYHTGKQFVDTGLDILRLRNRSW